ncbi:unnamed protein product, partial [Amoebophrya sp. A25]
DLNLPKLSKPAQQVLLQKCTAMESMPVLQLPSSTKTGKANLVDENGKELAIKPKKSPTTRRMRSLSADQFSALLLGFSRAFRLDTPGRSMGGKNGLSDTVGESSSVARSFRKSFEQLLPSFSSPKQLASCITCLHEAGWCASKGTKKTLQAGFYQLVKFLEAAHEGSHIEGASSGNDRTKMEAAPRHLMISAPDLHRLLRILGHPRQHLSSRNTFFERLVVHNLALISSFSTAQMVDFACDARECRALNSFPMSLVYLREPARLSQ